MNRFRRGRGRPSYGYDFSPAERRVLEHLRLGLTNAEIAERLGISPDGVKYHVSNMLGKLSLENRHQLAAYEPAQPARTPWILLPAAAARRAASALAAHPAVPGVALGALVLGLAVAVYLVGPGSDDDRPAAVLTPRPQPSATASPIATLPAPAASTATGTPLATITPSPSPAPAIEIPSRPAFGAFGDTIAAYLSAGGGVDDCLAALSADWALPALGQPQCVRGDFNGDGIEDLLLLAADPTTSDGPPIAQLLAFQGRTGGAFEPEPLGDLVVALDAPLSGVARAGQLNGESGDEAVVLAAGCGASTCFTSVQIYGPSAGHIALLTAAPLDVLSAQVTFEDHGASSDVLVRGGSVTSAGAGPQRDSIERWTWDAGAKQFRIASTEAAPSDYLYFAVVDGDAHLAAAIAASNNLTEISAAAASYERALDGTLVDWHAQAGTGSDLDVLGAYIALKLAIIRTLEGAPSNEVDALLSQAVTDYGGSYFASLAAAFKRDRSCAAVRRLVDEDPAALSAAWDFGANEPPPAETICPLP